MTIIEEYERFAQRPECVRYWEPVPIDPVPLLSVLRETVLAINAKRRPKWLFRLTEEVVLQLQPMPDDTLFTRAMYPSRRGGLFQGDVLQGPGISKAHFRQKTLRYGYRDIAFRINADTESGRWCVSVHCGPGPRHDVGSWQALKDVLIAGLPRLNTLDPDLMFQPACLICNRLLTDPVSRARWIGPECAGSGSLNVGIFPVKDA